MSTAVRRVGFVLGLAAFRLRRRRGRAALVAAGVAAGAAALAVVLGGRVVAQGESLAQALERVPRAERSVAVTYADLGRPRDGLTLDAVDPLARETVRELAGREADRLLQFKLLTIEGTPLVLAGADDVGRWVRLRSGRLPRTCTPARCEVVRLGGGDVPATAGLALEVVGEGTLRGGSSLGPLPGAAGAQVGETFSPETSPPLALAAGFDELAGLPALRSLYRTYAWVTPLGADRVRPWQVGGFTEAVARARSQLRARSLFLDVGAPTEELDAAGRDARVAGERLLLLGGQAAALVLAFALLAAGGLRTDAEAAAQRLTWFGARRWQLGLLAGVEALVLALAGSILGWAAGAAVTAILASRAGLPAADVIGHSLVSGGGLVAWLVLTAAAALVLVVALRGPAVTLGGRSLGPLDVAGVGALAAAAVVLALGRADADALAAGESGVALLLLPGLVSFAAAVACARLLTPAFAGVARAARAAPVGVRLSVVSLASRPGRAVLAVAFLATCVGLGIFAAVYRSTLAGGVDDQARYAVPADLTVRERLAPGGLVSPLELATLDRYRALGAARAVAVVRGRASVGAAAGQQVAFLALPSASLASLDGWRSDFSETSLAEIRRRISPPAPLGLAGADLSKEATAIALRASSRGGNAALTAEIATPRGSFVHVPLGQTRGADAVVLSGALPAEARGGRLVALSLARGFAAEGHGDFARVDGVLTLGLPRAVTPTGEEPLLGSWQDWQGRDNVEAVSTGAEARIRFLLSNEAAAPRFQPSQPTDAGAVPVLVSPGIAAAAGSDGSIPLRLPGVVLRGRVVAVAERFPSTSGDFIVADESTALVAANAARPGALVADEVWLDAGSPQRADALGAALARPPFDRLAVESRAALERRLRDDPLARGSLFTVGAAAAGAALLALVGLLLLVAADSRDERRELRDLEAEGMGPRSLRRHVRLRAGLVAVLGLAGGFVLAAVLAPLVVDLVSVTAAAATAEPPLVVRVGWPLLLAGLAAAAALATALVLAATRRTPS